MSSGAPLNLRLRGSGLFFNEATSPHPSLPPILLCARAVSDPGGTCRLAGRTTHYATESMPQTTLCPFLYMQNPPVSRVRIWMW